MVINSKESDLTIGTCRICGGTRMGRISSGSDYGKLDSMGIAKLGDTVIADCTHIGLINSGSDYHFIDGIPVAYPGDTFEGEYSGQILA